ncbi:MMPL family transporter [Natronolimnohabitans sp. A-GB9]|uniref:efflux RND transporter permease subunit n=1 Tax=Natronolimnohabitans sp. A-GB9 TaxID=3069757 RepID=UPI0027B7EA3B|nr:MMPL family transporter [Natronolimnohabitans sp. A-GB9]MDQ2052381.1 MMPL family transporter [Natronolimnohabitans sp. A-GB9]
MTADTDLAGRYADAFTRHYRLIAAILLLATAIVGVGAVGVGGLEMAEFDVETEETEAGEYVDDHFRTDDAPTTLIVLEDSNTLDRDSLLATMDLQAEIRANETISPTLADEQPTAGVGNAIAIAWEPTYALSEDGMGLELKRDRVAGMSDNEREQYLNRALHLDDLLPAGVPEAGTALPREYERGDETADARLVAVVHDQDATEDDLLEAQRTIEELTDDRLEADTFVFAEELAFERGAQATGENFGLIGPLAALLVGSALFVAYRDPLDVCFAVGGIGLTLVWLIGFLGWTGIGLNQLLIAVPCLLIGLSVDHVLHVVMRYREASETHDDPVAAMSTGLGSVVAALGITTFTTVVGFLSGLISPIGLLREFGLVAAVGIAAALLVFGGLIPALKLEADRHLDSWGYGRRRRSIGRLAVVERPLAGVVAAVRSAPMAVVVVAFLLATGGLFGLTGVDTESDRTDFFPESQPAWVAAVPGDLQPDDYPLQERAQFVDETFAWADHSEVEILIRGDVSDPETLERIEAGAAAADAKPPVKTVTTSTDRLEELSFVHDSVEEVYEEGESGVPDEDLETLYDVAYDADATTADHVLHRTDNGEYVAMRMIVDVEEDAAIDDPEAFGDVTDPIDDHPSLEATATGTPIVETVHDRAVVRTVFGTFLLALAVVAGTLAAVYRVRDGSWTYGVLVAVPVLLALSWVVLTMRLLGLSFTPEVAIIAGIGIGVGVDYTVHVAERYRQERQTVAPAKALERTVVDTGGTLFASGTTTALGFAVLLLTVVPSLQRFGLVTALVVSYSFVASVVVLPALLYLWEGVSGAGTNA